MTPSTISFLESPVVTNINISLSWESNENVTWECVLVNGTIEYTVNCTEAYWNGYNLSEGTYNLRISATDEAGNVATVTHTFEVDLTPPTVTIGIYPMPLSNQITSILIFSCDEMCTLECQLLSNSTLSQESSCNRHVFITPTLQHNTTYTFMVTATDKVNNRETATYTWETDFVNPLIFGTQNLSVPCSNTNPTN